MDIIIPTLNNPLHLELALKSIEKNSFYKHSIFVFFNNAIYAHELDAIANRTLFEHKYQWGAHSSNAGIAYAVNQATSWGEDKHIYLMDDDMYLTEGWDVQLMDFVTQNDLGREEPLFVCSTMIEPESSAIHSMPGNFGNIDTFEEERLVVAAKNMLKLDPVVNTYQPVLIDRATWEKVGGYSEKFFPGIGTDDDLAKKFYDEGCRNFVGCPSSLVYHFQSVSTNRINRQKAAEDRESIFKALHNMSTDEFHAIIKRGQPWTKQ